MLYALSHHIGDMSPLVGSQQFQIELQGGVVKLYVGDGTKLPTVQLSKSSHLLKPSLEISVLELG